MKLVSAQVSLYPLRQSRLGPAVSKALDAFRARGLDVRTGTMSTVIAGDSDTVFEGLKAAFDSAAALGDIVMVASVSNCCPAPAADRQE